MTSPTKKLKPSLYHTTVPYLEPKQGRDQDEELWDLDEDRPVLDVVEDEPGGDHAEPGHQERQPDLEQGRTPTLIRT